MYENECKIGKSRNFNASHFYVLCLTALTCFLPVVSFTLGFPSKVSSIVLVAQCLLAMAALLVLSRRISFDLVLYLVFSVCALVNSQINGSGMGSAVLYVTLMSFILLGDYAVPEKIQARYLNRFIFLILVYLLILYCKRDEYGYNYINIINGVSYNPNLYSNLLLAAAMLSFVVVDETSWRKSVRIIIKICSFALFLWLIYRTGSRNSLFCWALFALLYLIFRKRELKNAVKFYYAMIIVALLLPLLYMLSAKIFGTDTVILGKHLYSGRQAIWEEVFSLIGKNWFFGYSNKTMYLDYYTDAHNAFLAVWGNLGLVPFVGLVYFWGKNFYANKATKNCLINRTKMLALIVLILYSTFELSFMDAGRFFLLIPFLFDKTEKSYYDT